MNRRLTLLLLLVLYAVCIRAQTGEIRYIQFSHISRKGIQPVTSLYGSLTFMDSRQDTASIGFLDSGSRKIVRAVLKTPVQGQLTELLIANSGPNSGDAALLFQLRRFSFAETRGTRNCYLEATLYGRHGDGYCRIADLNTMIPINTPRALYSALQTDVNEIINDFFRQSIVMPPDFSETYTLDEIRRIDSVEKQRLPLYNTTAYTEGCYSTYDAFKAQKPDAVGDVITNSDGSIADVDVHFRLWKPERSGRIFALVYKGVPYVVTDYGFAALKKEGDEFYFTARLRIDATAGQVFLGQLMSSDDDTNYMEAAGDKRTFLVLLDHQTGRFIHLKML